MTPNASPEAKALLRYLYDVKGKVVLAGQHGINETEYIHELTGKYPAIKGYDLIHEERNRREILSAIDWWKRGGIPTVMWHWGAPSMGPGYENSKKHDQQMIREDYANPRVVTLDKLPRIMDYVQ